MLTAVSSTILAGAIAVSGGPVLAAQPETADAAMAKVQRLAQCPECEFDFASRAPQESARRGLVSIGVGDPQGGGYVMIMGYDGTRWARLWEGNGSTRNVASLPGKTVICMDPGGWTNIRKGPGTNFKRVGKVTAPTVKKVFEMRLETPVGKREGIGWYRISYNGGQAWVQNLRTLAKWSRRYSAAETCQDWRKYWSP